MKLGSRYRDLLTDFVGVAVARCEYLHDAPDVTLVRLDNDGRPEEFRFSEARLVEEPSVGPTFGAGF